MLVWLNVQNINHVSLSRCLCRWLGHLTTLTNVAWLSLSCPMVSILNISTWARWTLFIHFAMHFHFTRRLTIVRIKDLNVLECWSARVLECKSARNVKIAKISFLVSIKFTLLCYAERITYVRSWKWNHNELLLDIRISLRVSFFFYSHFCIGID